MPVYIFIFLLYIFSVTGWGTNPSKMPVWTFSCTVRIDTKREEPALLIAMKEGKNSPVCRNMMNYFVSTFDQLFPDYMVYRMIKWLDVGCTNQNH